MLQEQTTPGVLQETEVQDLRARLRGALLCPGDAAYEQALPVYNAMIEKHPAMIAHCVDVADVMVAVNCAREHRLPLAVRGSGHSGPGLGTCDDGLVIDLSGMKGIHVDPSARTARVEGGCTWGEVDHATHAFGLATPSGFISSTGVGGLTLGGGIGYLTRTLGLTIDNLLSVDVVLADGSFGAAHRVGVSDTAFSFRDANFSEVIVGVDPDPANNERMIQWARDYWMALHPYSEGGGYINMMMDEGTDNVKAAYRANYARLAKVKTLYDPSNLFHLNQNIIPAM
ncbi:MAG TPA: FAD-dependent oxidoreductase [Ktedonobacteraceae bacterium]